jgi:ABC-2 type transport system ATP-binding protein
VLFLDEPTTGLDPRSRLGMWEVIAELVRDGTTLLLTTQYLEEADRLASTIAVIDHGQVIARGSADELKAQTGGERIEVVLHHADRLPDAMRILAAVGDSEPQLERHTRRITVPVSGGARLLMDVIRELDAAGLDIDDVAMRRPTLDDVFLTLTGHAAESTDEAAQDAARQPAAAGGRRS